MGTALRAGAISILFSVPIFAQVQIGSALQEVQQSTAPRVHPLDRTASIHLSDVTFREFLDEVGRQTKFEFILIQGLDKCRISAALDGLSARQILQMTLEVGGMTYQSAGRSNRYLIARRKSGPRCPPPIIKGPTPGLCRKLESDPISFECSSSALGSIAELLNTQSGASVIVWNRAIQCPISLKVKKAELEKVAKKLRRDRSLSVRQLKDPKLISISLASENSEDNFVELPKASSESGRDQGKRSDEPQANPSFQHP